MILDVVHVVLNKLIELVKIDKKHFQFIKFITLSSFERAKGRSI